MQNINRLVGHYRTAISLLTALAFLALSKPSLKWMVAGIPFVILGESIRTWASGCLNKEYQEVTAHGPYSMTRNPLYVGNFFLGVGFTLMGGRPEWVIVFLALFYVIYRSTILDEENTLTRVFGEAYLDYKAKVPRFLPRFQKHAFEPGRFHWERVYKHREYNAWLGIGLLMLLMGLLSYFRMEP